MLGFAAKLLRPRASVSEGASAQPLRSRRRMRRRANFRPPHARAPDATSTSAAEASPSSSPPPLRPPPPPPLLDQASTPLLDAVLLRGSRTPAEAPFHVPGHKRGAGIAKSGEQRRGRLRHPLARLLGGDGGRENPVFALRHDLTELPGLDLLSQPEGPILEAQRLAAEAWGVSQTRFLVNGSTGGVAAAVLACCRLWARRPRRERQVDSTAGGGGGGSGEEEGSEDDDGELRLARPLVLISRGAHRSAAAAAELAGADVVWIEEEGGGPSDGGGDAPPFSGSESRWGSEGPGRVATAAGIRRALELAQELDVTGASGEGGRRREEEEVEEEGKRRRWKKKRAARVPAAVLVVSPSYFGACADVFSLAAACCLGGKKIPLIVDQAHGAHFGLDGRFPPCAAAAAASAAGEGEAPGLQPPPPPPPVVLAVASAHKTLDALGQAALLHSGWGVSEELQREVDRALAMLQTSSPSYLLLASLDAARAAGVGKVGVGTAGGGEDSPFGPWDEPLRAAAAVAEAVRSVAGAHLLSDEIEEETREGKRERREWDPLRLTVRLDGVGGRALAVALEEGGEGEEGPSGEASTAAVEMATSRAVVLALGAGSTVEHAEAFGRALRRVAARSRGGRGGGGGGESAAGSAPAVSAAAAASPPPPPSGSPPRATELIPLNASLGRRLAASLLAPYPPGVPLVLEGGALTAAAIAAAAEAWAGGSAVLGLSDGKRGGSRGEERGCRGEPFVCVFLR